MKIHLNKLRAQPVQTNLRSQKGWVTLEMLYAFPLLIAAMMLALYFGMLMHAKLMLSNATHSAVQALAKTKDCTTAHEYFKSNFPYSGSIPNCVPDKEVSEYSATYLFNAFPIVEVLVPSTTLESLSKAVTEKQD